MELIDDKDIPQLLARKKQPIIFRDTPKCNQFLNDFAALGEEVERRKAAAKLKKDA